MLSTVLLEIVETMFVIAAIIVSIHSREKDGVSGIPAGGGEATFT